GGAEPGDLPPHRQLNRVADSERRPRGRHREVLFPADEDITAGKTDEDDERGGPPPEKRGQEPQARPPEPAIPARWGMPSETSSSRVSGSPSRSLWISRSTPASWYCPIRSMASDTVPRKPSKGPSAANRSRRAATSASVRTSTHRWTWVFSMVP